MKQIKNNSISWLCAIILVSFFCAANVFAVDEVDEVTVTGTVYSTAYDENDDVTAAVIDIVDDEYVISPNDVGKELFKLSLKVVKASGVISQDSDGKKNITVKSYEIIQEYDEVSSEYSEDYEVMPE